ncbi:MAG: 4-(cytidine 5'-diphospho)-2-C-methyl-D-erythritol kinase [Nitrospirae bacterium]|nr:MAG: 4-(cytidine 5'-diphospho)-2-C-methyl-D-erythritol kinase [Nitrospirota bacterium]
MIRYSSSVALYPPAKINLVLKVLDRLSTGYHQIWSLMQTVGLEDELLLSLNPDSRSITLHCDGWVGAPGRENLVHRAAQSMLEASGIHVGLNIRLKKRIPVAAGLGGGSSDAAATLIGLNHLLALQWPTARLCEVGRKLGSDIPFFFFAPSARVSGWGEKVSPFTLVGGRWIVLVYPGFPISTTAAYAQLDAARTYVPSLPAWCRSFDESPVVDWDTLLPLMVNDFEPHVYARYPALLRIKTTLLEAGAQAALLSGSGATVFGVFRDEAGARAAQQTLGCQANWRVYVVPTRSSPLVPETPRSSSGREAL